MLIFLIGFMGSGKTTIGKKLAKKMKYAFLDLDQEIEKQENLTISQIFDTSGEDYFRTLENKVLIDLTQLSNTVVSCGGGTPCHFNNIDIINNAGISIYIQLSAEALHSRLKTARTQRPLLKNRDESELYDFIKSKLNERQSCYLKSKIVIPGLDVNIENLINYISYIK
jgi:shikimate kinase